MAISIKMTIREYQRHGPVRVREHPPRVMAGYKDIAQIDAVTFFNSALGIVEKNLALDDQEIKRLLKEESEAHPRAKPELIVETKEDWLMLYGGEEFLYYRETFDRTVRLMEEAGFLPGENKNAID